MRLNSKTMMAAATGALAAAPALAADWVAYRTNPFGAVFSYDRATLRRDGAKVLVSVRTDYGKTATPGDTLELVELDCGAGTATQKSFTRLAPDGKPAEVRAGSDLMAGERIVPGTPLATLRRTICG